MAFLWFVAATGWLLALVTFVMVRRVKNSLDQLTTMYWELKYEHGELKARVKGPEDTEGVPPRTAAPVQAFVPLGTLRKKS